MLAHSHEGMDDVEVVHPHQVAASRVEEDELAQGEKLEGTAEARARPPRRFGHPAHLAVIARVEVHQPIAFPERAAADDHGLRGVEGHGYEARRGAPPPFRYLPPTQGEPQDVARLGPRRPRRAI